MDDAARCRIDHTQAPVAVTIGGGRHDRHDPGVESSLRVLMARLDWGCSRDGDQHQRQTEQAKDDLA